MESYYYKGRLEPSHSSRRTSRVSDVSDFTRDQRFRGEKITYDPGDNYPYKRPREVEEYSDFSQKKRKQAPFQDGPTKLTEEEQLLLNLREQENLQWKDIATRFQIDRGKSYEVPALQMRYIRLRERTWS